MNIFIGSEQNGQVVDKSSIDYFQESILIGEGI